MGVEGSEVEGSKAEGGKVRLSLPTSTCKARESIELAATHVFRARS